MINEDNSVTQRLLSTPTDIMDKARIENEVGVKGEDNEGDLRLHDAVCDPDDIEEIERLVSEEPTLVFERDKEFGTPLHSVALAGDEQATEIAKILVGATESEEDQTLVSIERPEILNLQDSQNFTALHYAASGRQPELVAALLRWGANPGIKEGKGNTALHLAAEGNTDKAIECVKLLLKEDTKRVLINSSNNEELLPLHRAITKKAVRMVNFLLQPEFKCDLSLKNQLGRTAVHFACSESGESDNSCEVVKAILKRCTKAQLNHPDNRGRTALHLASIKRLPRIANILVQDERMDVLKTDDIGRTALHYAAEDGCYTKGYQCVEALIDREFPNFKEQVNYLYKIEDQAKNTPFMYACINCPVDTMKKYIALAPHPKYWLSNTYMTLVYKNSPLPIKALMDKAFSEDDKSTTDSEDAISTDFGLITGYLDPVDVAAQQETKYLKEALWWDYEAQRDILLHPLVQFFIAKKWQKIKSIIILWIISQLIWLAAYTFLALSFYSANVESKATAVLGSGFMLIYLFGSVVNESFEIYTIGSAYVLSLTNLMQLLQNFLGFIAIYPVFTGYDKPDDWMKYTTAVGILLAYIMSMRDIGKLHSKIGLIVEVLKQVLIQIMEVLLCCAPLWIGFTLAFIIIFDDEESLNSRFPGPIVKVLVMMTGEFEYNDTFKDDPESGSKSPASAYIRVIRLMFFLAFLISVPVGFFNLLTGFALDKVMELRERAKVARIAKQLEHIYFIESILLGFRPLRKIFSHSAVVSFLRRLNVTSAWIDGELKFETSLKENIRKSERNLRKGGFRGKMACGNVSFCEPELGSEVREQIYALACPPSKDHLADDKAIPKDS